MMIKELIVNGKQVKIAGIIHVPFERRNKELEEIIEEADVVAYEGYSNVKFHPSSLINFFSLRELLNMRNKPVAKIDPVYVNNGKFYIDWGTVTMTSILLYLYSKFLTGKQTIEDYLIASSVLNVYATRLLFKLKTLNSLFNAITGNMGITDKIVLAINNSIRNIEAKIRIHIYPRSIARDIGMAYNIYKLSNYFNRIAVFVGYGHLYPIYNLLKNPEKLKKLYSKFRKYYKLDKIPVVIIDRGRIVKVYEI